MEQSNIKELARVNAIAHGRISVAEDSPIFNLFVQRRELCRVYNDGEEFAEYLKALEDNIKRYLCL